MDRFLSRSLLLPIIIYACLAVATAHAHAGLVEASPKPGEELYQRRPPEVRLRFAQEMAKVSIVVTDNAFQEVQRGGTKLDPAQPDTAYVPLKALDSGVYSVHWRTEGIDDHVMEGSYEFSVNLETPPAAIFTRVVAAVVFLAMGILVYFRRANANDLET